MFYLANYTPPQDSITVAQFFSQFKAYQYENVDSALYFIDRAISHADHSNLSRYHALLLLEKGKFLKNNGRFQYAETTLQSSLAAYQEVNDSLGLAEVYTNLGIVYWRWLNNEKVMKYYMESLAINKAKKNLPGQIKNYMAIGNYYAVEASQTTNKNLMNERFQHAINQYDQALVLLRSAPHPLNLATTLQNKGNIYADTSFLMSDSGRALQNFRMSMEQFANLGDSPSIAGLQVSIGFVYEGSGAFDSATTHYERALTLYRKLHQDAFTLEALRNLGNVYLAQNNFSKARECFVEGMRYAKANNDLYSISGFYHRLAKANAGLEAYGPAYTYLDSSIEKLNVIYEENTHRYKMESETKYETSQKEAELKLKTVQRDGIMIVLIVVLSLSIIIVFLSRQRQKAVTSLRDKEEALHRQEVSELLKKQEISSLTSYLHGQDQERKRIAEDLHDRLGSTLSATKLYLNSDGDKNSLSYSKANLLLDQAVEEVREISHNLLSGTLSKFGLLLALEELKNAVTSSDRLKMEIFAHGVERLPNNIEIIMYRIIQELVSNILRHANAKEITVQLNRHQKELTLTVEDDGAGFDLNEVGRKKGIGLLNVESRVHSLNGSVYIDSRKGHGTTVTINIPLEG